MCSIQTLSKLRFGKDHRENKETHTLNKGHPVWFAMFDLFQWTNTNWRKVAHKVKQTEIIQYNLVYNNQMSFSQDNAFVFCTHRPEKHQEVLRKKMRIPEERNLSEIPL